MIGSISRTVSPSSVSSSRSTPCVAGWCGPMLMVNSSCRGSSSVPVIGCSIVPRSSVIDCSRSRYGTASPGWRSLIPARVLVLVVREQHRLAADREVTPLRVALVVLGHEDAAQVRMAVEDDAEHVVDLAFLEVRAGIDVDDGRKARLVASDSGLHVEPLGPAHREQLVVHA